MPTDLTLAELSALADVPTRTIRYYIAQGLLPAPGREGPATRYPIAALHRLRLVRQLQREHLPLAEIRKRLAALSDDELAELVEEGAPEPPADSALEYVRRVLAGQGPTVPVGALAPAPMPSPPEPPGASPGLRRSVEPRLLVPAPSAPPAPSAQTAPAAAMPPAPPAPSLPERSQWERIVLEPDVELHVRRPLSRIANKRVERLVAFARELLEEDRP